MCTAVWRERSKLSVSGCVVSRCVWPLNDFCRLLPSLNNHSHSHMHPHHRHRELCALQKLGGVPLAPTDMMRWCELAQAQVRGRGRGDDACGGVV